MRFIHCTLLIFLIFSAKGQDAGLLLRKELITGLSKLPIYKRLTEKIDGKDVLKKQYQYIDSLDIYSISYLSDGLKINGFVVKPKGEGNYPCIIYNRGGNRDFGALKVSSGIFTLGPLASKGYVVIASQYRGNGGSEGQEEFGGSDVNDITILPEVLKEIKGADTEKIGMYGWSRGGMMTYIALTKMDNIKAAVVGGAVSDAHASILDRPEMETGVMAELIPDYEANKEQELYKRSAMKWADQFPKNVPILMLHGNSDWRVKAEHSLNLALKFQTIRVPYRLIIYEGGDHAISEHEDEVDLQVVDWFDRYLKGDEILPNMEYHGR